MSTLTVVRFDQLSPDQLAAWRAVRTESGLDSPYFDPVFAEVVHAEHGDVRVVVADQDRGFLAVQCDRGIARPVGWPSADFQGPVAAAGVRFEPTEVLSALGVRALYFDHLRSDCAEFAPWVDTRQPSPYIDVTGGMAGYLARASRAGKDKMAEARRGTRRVADEHGPFRFEPDLDDPAILDRVIELKRARYRATGAKDYFAGPGRRALLHRLLRTRTPTFAGVLSAVFAGDRLVAGHFGIRSDAVLHWWFPVYDPALGSYSPGWVLLREMITAAPGMDVARIDLGRGEDEYKRRAMTGQVEVCQGMVAGWALRNLRKAGRTVRTAVRSSPIGPYARKIVHKLR